MMDSLFQVADIQSSHILSTSVNQIWYALPLIIAISLVYGATRHELMGPILNNAFRAATWIVGFMGIIFGILLVVSWAI